ncbi:hypothetical protein BGZ81_011235 [Podila clonocystis]|nr:hypothetical protein BGZ81_011235 [Podila clonocystis]
MLYPHPLELPELIYRIAWFLDWNQDDDSFIPTDLSACTQVNRLFHKTLTPLLWMIRHTNPKQVKIPGEVIEANIHHVRHLEIYSSEQPIWRATNLRTLLVVRFINLLPVVKLILSNPRLTSLEWYFPVHGSEQEDIILTALATLSQLKFLYLKNWRYNTIELGRVLCNTPMLQELKLYLPYGLGGSFDRCQPLEHLTTLWLDCYWPETSPGFPQLVRYCPRLEALYLNPLLECPIVDLSINLRECCSKLVTLKCGDYFHHDIVSPIWTADKDLALVESTANLSDFELPLCDLTREVLRTLLTRHSHSLTDVTLYFYRGGDPRTMANISSILASCLSLRTFGAGIVGGAWKPSECLGLFEQLWSSSLREFEIWGVSTDLNRSAYGDDDGAYDHTQPYDGNDVLEDFEVDPEVDVGCAKFERCQENTNDSGQDVKFLARYGWCAPKKYSRAAKDRALQSRDCNIFCKKLFEQAVSMPHMYNVRLNMLEWTKEDEE